MGLRDLLRRPSRGAKVAAAETGLLQRLRDAVKAPPRPNRYVAPDLRRLDAVAFALRGYRVSWTAPHVTDLGVSHQVHSSTLVYEAARWRDRARRYPVEPVYIELPTIVPGLAHRAASWVRTVHDVGPGFAWWQARREFRLVWRAMRVGRKRR